MFLFQLANAVVDDDRIVNGEAKNREERGHKQGINLYSLEMTQETKYAEDDKTVMEHGEDGGDAEFVVFEAIGDVEQDEGGPEDDTIESLGDELGTKGRTHCVKLLFGDGGTIPYFVFESLINIFIDRVGGDSPEIVFAG
jgi:hypothetical protein